MPISLRLLLFISSLFSFVFVVRRIRKSQVQLYDTTFWILLSTLFVVISIFPGLPIALAGLIKIQSPVNMVFLIIIFFLLGHSFIQSLRFSSLEDRFKRFVGEEALRDAMEKKEKGEKDE